MTKLEAAVDYSSFSEASKTLLLRLSKAGYPLVIFNAMETNRGVLVSVRLRSVKGAPEIHVTAYDTEAAIRSAFDEVVRRYRKGLHLQSPGPSTVGADERPAGGSGPVPEVPAYRPGALRRLRESGPGADQRPAETPEAQEPRN